MYTLRIPFASKTARDLALQAVAGLDYEGLDASEAQGAGVRAQAGEQVRGVRITQPRHSIVIRGKIIPQWACALAALLAWREGVKVDQKPWAQLYLNEELVLVAATSEDVRGTRGLMEVDAQGRLLAWRDGGGKPMGPASQIQKQAMDQVIEAIERAKVRKRLKK